MLTLALTITAEDWWIIATAAVTNAACALVGSYLVLRRLSMMGDALSHAVLPGVAAAFILSGSYEIGPLMIGAIVAGLLAAMLTQTLHHYARVPGDASMGVVFTSLFALGVVMIHKGVHGVHFDVRCVYEGTLELAPFYTTVLAGREVPQDCVTSALVMVVNLGIVVALWKELKISSFDPALATTMGFSASWLHYLLMGMVAITAVAAFKVVGSILVVAMLIVPPATAHLLADRLGPMMVVSVGVAIFSALAGYVAGVWFDVNLAGMMAVVATACYALAVLFSPRHGLASAAWHNLQTSLRVVREDLLGMLYRLEELQSPRSIGAGEAVAAVGGGLLPWWALHTLVRAAAVVRQGAQLRLTDAGRQQARQLVRSHRLWEAYLVRFLGLPLDHVHEPAHRIEHFIGGELLEELEENVDSAGADPHGREIPER